MSRIDLLDAVDRLLVVLGLAIAWGGLGATLLVAIVASQLTITANRVAAQNLAVDERAERREFGRAVQAYFDSRFEDLRNGTNWNMPHYAEGVRGHAYQFSDRVRADALFGWVTESMDRIQRADYAHAHDRPHDAFMLKMQVPFVIAEWVRDPEGFDPPTFLLYGEDPS